MQFPHYLNLRALVTLLRETLLHSTPPSCTVNYTATSTFRSDCIFSIAMKATDTKVVIKHTGTGVKEVREELNMYAYRLGENGKAWKWASCSCKRNSQAHNSHYTKVRELNFCKQEVVLIAVMGDPASTWKQQCLSPPSKKCLSWNFMDKLHSLKELCLEMRSCGPACLFLKSICSASCGQICYWNGFAHMEL